MIKGIYEIIKMDNGETTIILDHDITREEASEIFIEHESATRIECVSYYFERKV